MAGPVSISCPPRLLRASAPGSMVAAVEAIHTLESLLPDFALCCLCLLVATSWRPFPPSPSARDQSR
jgi:hypothetical protein